MMGPMHAGKEKTRMSAKTMAGSFHGMDRAYAAEDSTVGNFAEGRNVYTRFLQYVESPTSSNDYGVL